MAPGFYLNISAPANNTNEIIQLATPIDGAHRLGKSFYRFLERQNKIAILSLPVAMAQQNKDYFNYSP
uniref:Uncharacterized protein n=1 Tax=Glossina palpalis gambiensis TaxID=67801 RepID=A0A1B0C4G7_9MUSC